MTTDAELLSRFVNTRSNADFAELVHRHLDVVYHAALRRTGGRTDIAADIAQEVFVLLAQKAPRLVHHPLLAGWLHSTTRNVAHAALRKEARRQKHEQDAIAMLSPDTNAPEDWSRVREALDYALDELSTSDREAVLLRFFHKKTFTEVGTLLGLSEDAARKRVDRALDKLHSRLSRRGLTSTATALVGFLNAEAALAAPAGLATVVAQTAAATTAAAGISAFVTAKLMSIKTTTGLISAACVALVATVAITHDSDSPAPVPSEVEVSAMPTGVATTEPSTIVKTPPSEKPVVASVKSSIRRTLVSAPRPTSTMAPLNW